MGNQLEFLDILAIISFAIQMQNQQYFAVHFSNDDIMKELHAQDRQYLEVIMKQNSRIIELLETFSTRFVQSTSEADKHP